MTTTTTTPSRRQWLQWALWAPGLLVALGAGVATAHGLYEVALAARVPEPIAWLYPLITDGLALVAYVSTARLAVRSSRAYAWSVVVLAAGLSGIAQASYLAGGVASASTALRFGVGAWPAIAAAIVAHLLFLLGVHTHDKAHAVQPAEGNAPAVQELSRVQPSVHPQPSIDAVQPGVHVPAVQGPKPSNPEASTPTPTQTAGESASGSRGGSPARDRARSAARRYATLHNSLPTVSQLMQMANVARGTAGNALKELREQPTQLHVVNDYDSTRSPQ